MLPSNIMPPGMHSAVIYRKPKLEYVWTLIKQLCVYKSDKYQNSLTVASLKQSVILLIKQNMKQSINVSAMRLGYLSG